ncbi:hypothetical protein L596_007960 [Steinernema carpocapsae]|uniref:Helicase ATP-binding domain-containing protein n=1 Tax=Steinernema carpocapsae TaxID=34508 RepID=A0A4U5PC11_STECR|nr:hypothetical protein L596_007960 [Steinernema carpocapsae]
MRRSLCPSRSATSSPLVRPKSPESSDSEDESKRKRKRRKNAKPEYVPTPLLPSERDSYLSPYRTMLVTNIEKSRATPETAKGDHEEIFLQLVKQPFKVPIAGYAGGLSGRTLGLRRSGIRVSLYDPYVEGALVVFVPPDMTAQEMLKVDETKKLVHVVVDPMLGNILRPHQREGVKFMYDCVTGVRIQDFNGCIMADEMGLGKTLQCITLLWTLLRQSPEAKPLINKAIIVCPSSLVKNWDKEIAKWLGGRLNSLPIDSGKKEVIHKNLESFMSYIGSRSPIPVIIISYETFRLHCAVLHRSEVGLVICDEGHRLKNSDNQTYQALSGLQCKRRVLISGTPIQNDLLEYYSLVNFVNPGMLGTANEFKKRFENPILRSRDSEATKDQQDKGTEKLQEMSNIVSNCIIRRTSALLTKYLPIKYELIVCCKLSEMQEQIYRKLIKSRAGELESETGKMSTTTLSFITNLKKLCNHPALIWDKVSGEESGYTCCRKLYPKDSVPRRWTLPCRERCEFWIIYWP